MELVLNLNKNIKNFEFYSKTLSIDKNSMLKLKLRNQKTIEEIKQMTKIIADNKN